MPEPLRHVRRPVSAVAQGDKIITICDDGSVWQLYNPLFPKNPSWVQMPSVPGTAASGSSSR